MSSLKLLLLGPPHIECDNAPVVVDRRKAMALLAYLAVTGESQRRDTLATLLWPEADQSRARAALRRDLSVLNKALGEGGLAVDRETAGLNPSADIWLDVERFRDRLAACAAHKHPSYDVCPDCLPLLNEAVALYRDDFLAGFTLRDSPDFDEWQFFETESLRQEMASALERLVRGLSAQQEYEPAIPYARRWLALDPLHEPAHRHLMQLYALAGQRAAAVRQYRECERILDEELGVPPEEATTELYHAIKTKRIPSPPHPVTPVPPERGRRAPLPPFLKAEEEEPAEVEPGVFVARERELAQLGASLDRTLAGQGRVVFVTGEAGSGKTALVHEFARRAQDTRSDPSTAPSRGSELELGPALVVAIGNCSAHTGIGDPYLPFREILSLLAGDVGANGGGGVLNRENARRLWASTPAVVQALMDLGPDLIDSFVPSAPLAARAAAFGRGAAGWTRRLEELAARKATQIESPDLEQSRIFKQFTDVLQALARQQPLLLVLDDLQWADAASVSLLFHLGRRISTSRIMIVGAYRPEDVALGRGGERHPLESVVNEVKRYFGDVVVDLGRAAEAEGRHFVDALLDTESNRLGEEFRETLFQHTEGHPLFTIELLRDMQERGDLVEDDEGRLVEGPALDWRTLPARVEGVIEERIGRLEPELQDLLASAAVEGENFTAQVVALVQDIGERQTVRRLADSLDRHHNLVSQIGVDSLNGQRLYRFRFRHALFQQYLYDRLSPVERELLHADVGRALEQLYEDRTDDVAVRLVRHFDAAGDGERVLAYAMQAGDNARRLGASLEAVNFYRLALQEATQLDTPEDAIRLPRIHECLGDVYLENLSRHDEALEHYTAFLALAEAEEDRARGARKVADVHLLRGNLTEAQEHYERASAGLSSLRLTPEASRVHSRLSYLLISRNRLDKAADHAHSSLEISRQIDDTRGLADANRVMGIIANRLGELEAACEHHELSLKLYRELGDLTRYAQACNNVGDTYRQWGQMNRALEHLNEGLEVAQRIGDTRDEALLLTTTAELFLDQGQWEKAIEHLMQAIPLAEESGMAARIIAVHWHLGSAYLGAGQMADARRHLEKAETLCQDMQHLRFAPRIYVDMARLNSTQGEIEEAWKCVQLAVDTAGPEPSDAFLGVTHRCYGILHGHRRDWDAAIGHLEKSLKFLERANLPAEVGETRLSLSTAYATRRQEGDRERACDQLHAALSIFRQIEARGYLAQVVARLQEMECES
ncbi:MAG: tetratricopeptide repeat protein [Anaerolineae bacterium]